MKIHRHLVAGALDILEDIFQGSYADKAIEKSFKAHKQWGARDRHFVAETVYECTRWWSKIWFGLGVSESECLEPGFLRADSQMGWHFIGAYLQMQGEELPAWTEFADTPDVLQRLKKLRVDQPEAHAIPSWLFEKGQQELGENWIPTLQGLNQKATVILRANRLQTTPEALQTILRSEDVETTLLPNYPDALQLTKRVNVFRLQAFQNGLFEVQDAASQKVAAFLDPRPGERIADTCAGAGGKALHLAALMQNKGKVIAMDIHEWKLKELKNRAARNKVDIIETRVVDSTKVLKRLHDSLPAVLLDVPCSGLGALRRNPDSKWKIKPQTFVELQDLQRKIVTDNCKLVAPRGRMVYATCSVLPSENELQVQWFLKENKGFELVKEHWENPAKEGFDGFYMALLKRI